MTPSISTIPSPITASAEAGARAARVAYFAHELSDPAVTKRVRMLRAGGCTIELLGFERGRFGETGDPHRHVLGRTKSGKFLQRIVSVLRAGPRAWAARAVWADADVIIARNLEMLALVLALTHVRGDKRRVIYECLDIHRLMLNRGPVGALLRWIERLCLARASLLITSSPAFEEKYFRGLQRFNGEILLLENKVLALDEARPALSPQQPGPPWRITWCGVLRCARSFNVLDTISRTLDGALIVDLWGVPATDQIPNFHERVAANPHLRFHGRYEPGQLGGIYSNAHFVWAIDYFEAGGNSDWLLPNRLYEGLRFGCVPIAAIGTETARWLGGRCLGLTLGEPLIDDLYQHLKTMPSWRQVAMRADVMRLDPRATAFSTADCAQLAARVRGAREAVKAA